MKVVIVGGGPSGLFCAQKLLENGHEVHLYERGSSVGKKLLVAGKSGLNITHSESVSHLKNRYFGHEKLFLNLLTSFSNIDLVSWLQSLGVETYVGSSGRIFPKEFKAALLLKNIINELKSYSQFKLHLNTKLQKINKNSIILDNEEVTFDKVVYCLGGASWSKLGSDGMWKMLFKEHAIVVNDFYSMNCGFEVDWSDELRKIADNIPIKNLMLKINDTKAKGDVILTSYGIEGGPVYGLSYAIQKELRNSAYVDIEIDFLPDLSIEEVNRRLTRGRSKDSLSNLLRKKFKFSQRQIKFFKELSPKVLKNDEISSYLKKSKLRILNARPIDEAISTGGGIDLGEVTEAFEIKKLPNHYAIGEMLDWSAPTGGYLLQGCFSQAYRVAEEIV